MSNMSYCRFQNTSGDLEECLDALEEGASLSSEEHRAATRMFLSFLRFCREAEIIEDFDQKRLAEYLQGLRTGGV